MTGTISLLAQVDEAGAEEVGDSVDFGNDFFGDGFFEVNNHHGAFADGFASNLHSGDVDVVLAQDGADLTDHARTVVVGDEQDGAFGDDIDAQVLDGDDVRFAPVEDGAVHLAGTDVTVVVAGGAGRHEVGVVARRAALGFDDLDAARLGQRGGVDIADVLDLALQQAFEEDAREGAGVVLGEFARVDDFDFLDAARRDLRLDAAQLLHELEEGGDEFAGFGRERRQIDGALGRATFEHIHDLAGDIEGDFDLGFFGGGAEVRSEDDVGKAEKRRLFGRFLLEDVESGAADYPVFESLIERGFVDDATTRAVEDDGARFHLVEDVGANHVVGFFGERRVEGDEVAATPDFFEGDGFYAQLRGAIGTEEGVVAEHGHAEALGALGDFDADTPDADDAEGFAVEFGAQKFGALPLAARNGVVRRNEFAHEREHHAEREFGDGDGVSGRAVDDDDARFSGGGYVDVIDAHARAPDDLQFGGGFEDGTGDFGAGAHHDGVVLRRDFDKFGFAKTYLFFDLPHLTQNGETIFGDGVAH